MAFLCFFPIPHTASRRQIDATPCQCVPPSLFSCNAMQTVRKRLQDIQFIVKAVIHHHWPIFWLQNFWWKCGNDVPWNRSNPSKSHRSNLSSPPIYPSVCLLVSPCVYLICLSFLPHTPYLCRIYVPIFVPVYAICLSVYLSIYLSIFTILYLPICPSTYWTCRSKTRCPSPLQAHCRPLRRADDSCETGSGHGFAWKNGDAWWCYDLPSGKLT
jgi:hypothetical protein